MALQHPLLATALDTFHQSLIQVHLSFGTTKEPVENQAHGPANSAGPDRLSKNGLTWQQVKPFFISLADPGPIRNHLLHVWLPQQTDGKAQQVLLGLIKLD